MTPDQGPSHVTPSQHEAAPHLPHVLGNTVECQARLVGDDVEVLTYSLGGFLDLESQIRLHDISVVRSVLTLFSSSESVREIAAVDKIDLL